MEVDQASLQHKTMQICFYNFNELFQALLHLKIMRTYIDGVLRYGIPPKFYMGILKPAKGQDKKIMDKMLKIFAEEHL